ncbi:MAG: hypothetical protein U0325_28115 [Polyangiales bacterium]
MRVIDLGLCYLLAGAALAAVLRARRPDLGLGDALLTLTLWPLYAPLRFAGPAPRARPTPAHREQALLEEALAAARVSMGAAGAGALLPTDAQVTQIGRHLARLDARVRELDAVLARDEFDVARAERRMREPDRAAVEAATATLDGVRRLVAMRERAARERDEVLGLCARLRMQVTVLRFSEGAPGEHLGEVVEELLAHLEGVGAALDPAVASPT